MGIGIGRARHYQSIVHRQFIAITDRSILLSLGRQFHQIAIGVLHALAR